VARELSGSAGVTLDFGRLVAGLAIGVRATSLIMRDR